MRGFTVGDTTGIDIASGATFSTLNVSEVTLNGTGRPLNLTSGALNATFQSITATAAPGGQGINLGGITGTMTVTGGTSITNPASQCILVGTTTAAINFGNTTCSGGTDGVSFQNNSSGTRTFGTLTVSGNSGVGFLHAIGGGAVSVTGATSITPGATGGVGVDIADANADITFAGVTVNKSVPTASADTGANLHGTNTNRTFTFGALSITTSNGAGLVANGGGTINSSGGSIAATGLNAVNLSGVALGLNFSSLSSTNSSNNGVNLFTVTGTLTTSSTTVTNPSAGQGMQVSSCASGTFNFGNANIAGQVLLSSNGANVTFADLDISPPSGTVGVIASGSTGTLTSTSGTISTTNAAAIDITGVSAASLMPLSMTLDSVSANISAATSKSGVTLTNTSGTLTMNAGTITGGNAAAFNVSGGSVNATYKGNVSQANAQRIVNVDSTTGGTIAFNTGTVTSAGSSTGVNINNANGAVSFAGYTHGTSGARLSTQAVTINGGTGTYSLGTVSIFTNGAQGIVATNADGTRNITSGTVDATAASAGANAAAINIDGPAGLTTLGMTLTNVSSNNSTNGILIQDTDGSFTVNGGTIQNATTRGASLINTASVTLTGMTFSTDGTTNSGTNCGDLVGTSNTGCSAAIHMQSVTGATLTNVTVTGSTAMQEGINLNTVNGLTMTNVSVSGVGNAVNECGVNAQNLGGTGTGTGGAFKDNFNTQFRVINNAVATSALVLSIKSVTGGSNFIGWTTLPATGGNGIQIISNGTSNITSVTIQGNKFQHTWTEAILISQNSTSATFNTVQIGGRATATCSSTMAATSTSPPRRPQPSAT